MPTRGTPLASVVLRADGPSSAVPVLCFPAAFGNGKISTTKFHLVNLDITKPICSTITARLMLFGIIKFT